MPSCRLTFSNCKDGPKDGNFILSYQSVRYCVHLTREHHLIWACAEKSCPLDTFQDGQVQPEMEQDIWGGSEGAELAFDLWPPHISYSFPQAVLILALTSLDHLIATIKPSAVYHLRRLNCFRFSFSVNAPFCGTVYLPNLSVPNPTYYSRLACRITYFSPTVDIGHCHRSPSWVLYVILIQSYCICNIIMCFV